MKLPIYYLPSTEWFSDYINDNCPELDADEPYRKQTARNHCIIDSPQGELKLTVPVASPLFDERGMLPVKEIRISEHGDWRRKHWHALETTYYNSPFFEYLQDDYRGIILGQQKYLVDLNVALIEKSMEVLLGDLGTLERYKELMKSRKAVAPIYNNKVYHQVFSHKHSFIPRLSVIDLIFNMGNEAILYL